MTDATSSLASDPAASTGRGSTPGPPTWPAARGPLSTWVLRRLAGRPTAVARPPLAVDPLTDDDLNLALHLLEDLAYRPLAGAAPASRHDPLLDRFRVELEDAFLEAVEADVRTDGGGIADRARRHGPGAAVDALLAGFSGPSLSAHVAEAGTARQFRELLVHRSAYQLKEADPHTFGLARLRPGARKSAYATIQFDEYGEGRPGASHAELFAAAMAAAGLDPTYGAHLSALPGPTLATANLLSVLAARPERLGELVGHLALFEMTSVEPMGRYAAAARRLGLDPAVARFYDVHVVADDHHGRLAREVLLGDGGPDDGLDPEALVFGAHALLRAEDRFARHVLAAWADGRSSLLDS